MVSSNENIDVKVSQNFKEASDPLFLKGNKVGVGRGDANNKLVIACVFGQYGHIFLVLFFLYCTRLKARAISRKNRTRKIYLILPSYTCDNMYIL